MNYAIVASSDNSVVYSISVILKEGFIVEDVNDFEKLLEVFYRRRPSVVIIDLPFDEKDPIEILESIKKISSVVPVIFLFPSFNNKAKECLENGAYDILEKPFNPDILLHKVNQILEREKILSEREIENEKKDNREKNGDKSNSGESSLFQHLFEIIADKFPRIEILAEEILKALRENFYLTTQTLFLFSKSKFLPFATIGIEKNLIKKIKLDMKSGVVKYLLSTKSIVDISERNVPVEVRNFVKILNGKLLFPLFDFSGKLFGFFVAGDKVDGSSLSPSEIRSLYFLFDYITPIFENIFFYNEMEEQKSFQESILQNIPAGVIGINRAGAIFILNSYAEKILGVEEKNLKGEKIEKLSSQMADYLRRTLELGKNFEREEFNFIPNKKTIGLSTNCLKNEKGEVIGAVAIFQDLTFIKEMKEKEKEMERSKYWASLASRLSHELKNPLVAINTFVQLLPEKYDEEEFRTKFSKVVIKEVARLNEVVRKINALADRMELNYKNVNILKFLKEITAVSFKGDLKISGDDVYVKIDPDKFKEAINYLFELIKEDTEEGGKVEIDVRKEKSGVKISIIENGKKINFGKKEEIFSPFNSYLKSTYSIGIMLTKKIIEAHKGILKVDVIPEGKVFRINLFNENADKNEKDTYS